MNPWIDVGLWMTVILGCVALYFEVPRAVREIRKILREAKGVQEHCATGAWQSCVHCGLMTKDRLWHRCPSCGSNHQPV